MSLGRVGAIFRPPPADQYRHYPTPRLAVWFFHFYHTPPCEAPRPFSVRPHGRVPVRCFLTSSRFGNSGVGGLVLLVLVTRGCTERTIPRCEETPVTTPCVGPCTVDAEPARPTDTQVTRPLAVVIQDQQEKRHGQAIQP